MEYKHVFKSENGAVLEMTIKADCSTQEEMHKAISGTMRNKQGLTLKPEESCRSGSRKKPGSRNQKKSSIRRQ